jgi:endoglucanase
MNKLRPRLLLILTLTLVAVSAGIGRGSAASAAGTFITSAAATPSPVGPGGSTTIGAQVTSSTSTSVLVDVEVYSPTKMRVFQQYWDNQAFAAGQMRSFSATWSLSPAQAAGAYTVEIGVFSPGWGSTLNWNGSAGQISVTNTAPLSPITTATVAPATSAPLSFTTTATAAPAMVPAGSTTSITLDVTASSATKALVDLEVYSASGAKVYQQFWDNQQLAGTSRAPFLSPRNSFTASWAVPGSQAPGVYMVNAGIFTPGWGSQLNWNSDAGQVTVTGVSSTPTPTPSTTPSPTATPQPSPSPTPSPTQTPPPTTNGSPAGGVHVSGDKLVNNSGQQVRLHAVNRSGSEYACIQGWGFFDGPSDAGSISAIASWKVNAIRVPLNEDCWLGINGAPAAYSGSAYLTAIVNYVNAITAAGMAAIVDLHWTAPGTTQAAGQQPMPDLDHSPAFWTQVANTFKGNNAVILELFNEPYAGNSQASTADWACWRDGGNCADVSYPVAGMQTLINSVRGTGAGNVILLGGMAWSNDLSQWLTYEPSDPLHNTGAAWHVYNNNTCSNLTCYSTQAGPVAAVVPIVATEIGEDDCLGGFITPLMNWLDGQGQSYSPWTWDTWGPACGSYALITSYGGAATQSYGQTYHDHLASLP